MSDSQVKDDMGKLVYPQNIHFARGESKQLYGVPEIRRNLGIRNKFAIYTSFHLIYSILGYLFLAIILFYVSVLPVFYVFEFIVDSLTGNNQSINTTIADLIFIVFFILGLRVMFEIFRSIFGFFKIHRDYNNLINNGDYVQGLVTSVKPHGTGILIRYEIQVAEHQFYGEYVTVKADHIKKGDTVEVLWVSPDLHIPI